MTTITWYGHAVFTIADANTTLLIDPLLTGNPTAAVAAEDLAPTAILVTHGHGDHLGDAVDISKRTGAPIVAAYELALFLGHQGGRCHSRQHRWHRGCRRCHGKVRPRGAQLGDR